MPDKALKKKFRSRPEKIVQAKIQKWAIENKWSLDVCDSGFIVSKNGVHRNTGLRSGTPDLVGCTNEGHGVFLELKRPGHADVCRYFQWMFLYEKIRHNAFALVTDSPEHLSKIYHTWISLRSQSLNEAQNYLLSQLPQKALHAGKIVHPRP